MQSGTRGRLLWELQSMAVPTVLYLPPGISLAFYNEDPRTIHQGSGRQTVKRIFVDSAQKIQLQKPVLQRKILYQSLILFGGKNFFTFEKFLEFLR
jgi:hypothetical protein